MIIDKISNLKLYKNIPNYVLEFVENLTNEKHIGRYDIFDECYANIETYNTKPFELAKYEIHKKYIDIQILLSGKERIYYKNLSDLRSITNFNEEKDIAFLEDKIDKEKFVTLDSTNFALIFPHEAHAPQIFSSEISQEVKKAVIKLPF